MNDELIKRSKALETHLDAAIKLAQMTLPKPFKAEPVRCWVFYNDRGEPQHVAEEPRPLLYNRKGRWLVMESQPFSEVKRVN